MIKKVILYNFESHENTTINFAENFNLIIGESNSGKSAIIRAMSVVVNNDWNKDMVRTGCEFCRVTIETERGWVEVERGEKINKWRCYENGKDIQCFKNVGTKVPDLATKILGMGERDRGGDIKELPNFQFQLERHYMLSEIGEKKATSNMIARMMDNAIGLGGMEDLIKDISTDLLKDKKWLTEKQSEITELKTSIIDEKIFNSYEKLIKSIEDKNIHLSELDEDIEVADNYINKFNDVLNKNNVSLDFLKSFTSLNKIIELKDELDVLNKKINIYEKANSLNEKISHIKDVLSVNIEFIYSIKNKCVEKNKLIELCNDALCYEKNIKKIKDILDINTDLINKHKEEIDEKIRKINEAVSILEKARDLWKKKISLEKEQKSMKKELLSAENEYEKLKDELGFCPLCGEKLKKIH